MDVIPGRDGQERVFVLKTKKGLFKRPTQRVYPLEIEQGESEDFSKDLCKRASSKKRSNKTNNCNNDERLICEQKDGDPKIVTTRSGRIVKKPDRFEY